jgi:hypothetical protein
MPGTERVIAFSQLAVKGLKNYLKQMAPRRRQQKEKKEKQREYKYFKGVGVSLKKVTSRRQRVKLGVGLGYVVRQVRLRAEGRRIEPQQW